MRVYLRIFILAFVAFTAMFTGAYFALDKYYENELIQTASIDKPVSTEVPVSTEPEEPVEVDNRTELEKLADASNRINIIAFGLNDGLADTMMLISFDPDTAAMDVISVPRDTYYPIEGFNDPTQKKINAVYGMKEVGGSTGMKNYLAAFFGVPVDYYVRIDFKAVAAIVDVLGGYDVNVPFDMDYDDEWDNPPLHIHFAKGSHHLSGAETVKYLRWRKNNDGSHSEGDIQRVSRQQTFVKSMLKKALSSKLPTVINTAMKYIKTDMTLETALGYAIQAASMEGDDIIFHTVAGTDKMMNGLSYWIHDPAELETLMYGLYGVDANNGEGTDTAGNSSEQTPQ
ncbi:LCP family protein [Fusibacter paucivorans]|uniref:LCP family protein n=1 Tax=Fusibacter paucivorans TaxID=76009 RepID=A0ABS5PQD4_9FIRM|nr:LCP family protein [Fusibacter paucivorans]MBS7527261.1 LCP family protein [Fusibacter paucivorans]